MTATSATLRERWAETQSSAPAAEPVTLSEAKAHCRVDATSDDDYLGTLISVARDRVEKITGRQLMTATWRMEIPQFPVGRQSILLRHPPVTAITSITYVDVDGATQTLGSAVYALDKTDEPGRVVLAYDQDWPALRGATEDRVKITYTAGYASAAAVPAPLKHAIKLLVGHWYVMRQPVIDRTISEVPLQVEALCDPWRVMWEDSGWR